MLTSIQANQTKILKKNHVGGEGDNRAVTELGFAHITTKTWAYFEFLDFSDFFLLKVSSPPGQTFLKIRWEIIFCLLNFFNTDINAKKT